MRMDPNKRGNPPFEPSSYAAGLERRVERYRKWCAAAEEMARDLLDGQPLDKITAEAWWRQHLSMPQVVLSVDDLRRAAQGIEARSAETQSGSAVGKSPVSQGDMPNPQGDHHDR